MAFDFIGGTAKAVLSQGANIRERFIQRVLAKIVVFEITAKVIERILNGDQRRGGLVLLLNVLSIITDNYADALEDMEFIFPTTIFNQLRFDIAIKMFGLVERIVVGKNGIGVSRR